MPRKMRNGLLLLVAIFIGTTASIFATEDNLSNQQTEMFQSTILATTSPPYSQIYTTYYPPIYSPPVVVGPTITTYYPPAPVYVGPPVIVRPWRPFLNAFLP